MYLFTQLQLEKHLRSLSWVSASKFVLGQNSIWTKFVQKGINQNQSQITNSIFSLFILAFFFTRTTIQLENLNAKKCKNAKNVTTNKNPLKISTEIYETLENQT